MSGECKHPSSPPSHSYLAPWFWSSLLVQPGLQVLGLAALIRAALRLRLAVLDGLQHGDGLALGPAAPHALPDGQWGQRVRELVLGLHGAAPRSGRGQRRNRALVEGDCGKGNATDWDSVWIMRALLCYSDSDWSDGAPYRYSPSKGYVCTPEATCIPH